MPLNCSILCVFIVAIVVLFIIFLVVSDKFTSLEFLKKN